MAVIIPTYYHPGGGWWISAMRQTWYWVAHLAARDALEGVVRPRPEPSISAWREAPNVIATGGNPPRSMPGDIYRK